MQTCPHFQRLADASCLASTRNWRTHAEIMRDNADASFLTTRQRTALLREAAAADRQANHVLAAIRTH